MCPEMNQGIRFKFILNPQVGGDIGMWRCDASTVYDLELVIPFGCMRLGEKYDVSELQAGDGQRRFSVVFGTQVVTRRFPVFLYYFFLFIGYKRFCSPLFIVRFADP